ncbi:response regulator transcription factor [Vagococcus entomophilus]|uniref:DNA-binding response regulator n=1 Tax=Vagococcus entomophilus TaxID=1160095 RepID=A0A430AGL7_9ENTE|nr:response regulator transcription factor [Vagococcus entomophilus]RSU07062.1 DNA-binding response regulator [Vagococcus entomophilus]
MDRILLVEDNESINYLVKSSLEAVGYTCIPAADGEVAADLVEQEAFDLAIVDIMLPKIDGYELIRYFQEFQLPVIFLTAKDSLQDKVKGLQLGADDYIAKPFEIVELLARVEAVLRRLKGTRKHLIFGEIELSASAHTVFVKGERIRLSPKEFNLLEILMINKNIALSREYLYQKIWGKEELDDSRTVDLHVQRLRKKAHLEKYIVTISKYGYRMEWDG